jgi:ABC-2 type transport system ATP-binding protein
MDDVAALCQRVIVIDRGRLCYEGDLRILAQSIRPDKSIVLRFTAAPDREALARVGTVTELDGVKAVVRVAQKDVREAVSHLLLDPGIVDLTIEDPPLEEVLRELFARSAEETP